MLYLLPGQIMLQRMSLGSKTAGFTLKDYTSMRLQDIDWLNKRLQTGVFALRVE